MAAERYLSRRIPDSRVGNDIDKIDKKPVPSIYVPDENEGKLNLALLSYIYKPHHEKILFLNMVKAGK